MPNIEYDLDAALHNWLHALAGILSDGASPFWWPSLIIAALAGVVIARIAGVKLVEIHRQITPEQKRHYLREFPIDLACWIASTTLPFLFGPILILMNWAGIMVAIVLFQPVFGAIDPQAPPPGVAMLVLAAALAFIGGDFMLYWTHRWFHRFAFLWRMHKLHHAPPVLTPITAFRFWPQEHLVHMSGNMFGQGIGIGLAMALAGTQISAYTVLGTNIVMLVWGTAFAHLRHSPIPLPYPRWLSRVVCSPHMHQAHHSVDVKHYDCNFSTALSVWDWIFGTLYIPRREERFRFGVEEAPAPAPQAAQPAPR